MNKAIPEPMIEERKYYSSTDKNGVEISKSVKEMPLLEGGTVYICCKNINGPKKHIPDEYLKSDDWTGDKNGDYVYLEKKYATLVDPENKSIIDQLKSDY